ncbi:MAG: glycosyltransferase [Sulfolobales archaeon]
MKVKDKEDYLVFGGRPEAGKGLIEALLVFKQITRYKSNLKLFITGRISKELLMHMKMICKKLGIGDKVVFTGFIPRGDRFEIVAKAKLMLYPSHVDSFSYAVLESLHLKTPVVAYEIPALKIYYGEIPGVRLVKEWDLEGLTIEAINVLEKGVELIEPPKIKSWDEIMNEEVRIVQKLITTGRFI